MARWDVVYCNLLSRAQGTRLGTDLVRFNFWWALASTARPIITSRGDRVQLALNLSQFQVIVDSLACLKRFGGSN